MLKVKLAHCINPNRFFVCDLSNQLQIHKLREQEKQFQEICKQNCDNRENLKNQKNAWFFSTESSKFIRCEVDDVNTEDLVILWATDYGIPLVSREPEKLIYFDCPKADLPSLVRACSLNVLPAEKYFNIRNYELRVAYTWSNEAIAVFKKSLTDVHAIHFQQKFQDGDIEFGELVIEKTEGNFFELGEFLIKNNLAIKLESASDFISHYNRGSAAVTERWNDNEMSGGVIHSTQAENVGEIGELMVLGEIKFSSPVEKVDDSFKKYEFEEIVKSSVKVNEWLENVQAELEKVRSLSEDSFDFQTEIEPLENGNLLEEAQFHRQNVAMKSMKKEDQASSSESSAKNTENRQSSVEAKDCQSSSVISTKSVLDIPAPFSEMFTESSSDITPTLEKWMALSVGKEYNVFVTSFGSCNSFFIQVIDDEDRWDDLTEAIKNLTEIKPLKNFKAGDLCLVTSSDGDLCRAKIIRKSPTLVVCFCVDTAEQVFFYNEIEKIYKIPDEIVEIMPFQAVNCQLSAVRAPSDFALTHFIYNRVVKRMTRQKVRIVRESFGNFDMIPWELNNVKSYEVILFEDAAKGDPDIINDLLVEMQLVEAQQNLTNANQG